MGYESDMCGSIEIDKKKWEEFCNKNTEVQEACNGQLTFVNLAGLTRRLDKKIQ